MKILLSVDPEIPVPPVLYGGIERIVSALCQQYTAAGHTVYLLSNPGSTEEAVAQRIAWKGLSSVRKKDVYTNARQMLRLVKELHPDIIHSFSRLLYTYPILITRSVPLVQSYQREISPVSTGMVNAVGGSQVHFTACGAHMFSLLPHQEKWTAIHNFTDTDYFQPLPDAELKHLFFLGRIEPIKGVAEAIEVALRAEMPLVIAGNIPQEHQAYFDLKVKPHLDNPLIDYVGTVNDEQKLHYLQQAKALLFPISWEEPFGIVMAESMACGTPVVAFRRGSVEEVVCEGVNGFKAETVDEMVLVVKKLNTIDRQAVRQDAEKRFSAKAIGQKYLTLFENILREY